MLVELCLRVSYRAMQNVVPPLMWRKASPRLSEQEMSTGDPCMWWEPHPQQPSRASSKKLSWRAACPWTGSSSVFPVSRVSRENSGGICCSSAWYQQRQRSDDRPFLDEKLELSSKAPNSLKHIWNDLWVYRSRRGTLSYPLYLLCFSAVPSAWAESKTGWAN